MNRFHGLITCQQNEHRVCQEYNGGLKDGEQNCSNPENKINPGNLNHNFSWIYQKADVLGQTPRCAGASEEVGNNAGRQELKLWNLNCSWLAQKVSWRGQKPWDHARGSHTCSQHVLPSKGLLWVLRRKAGIMEGDQRKRPLAVQAGKRTMDHSRRKGTKKKLEPFLRRNIWKSFWGRKNKKKQKPQCTPQSTGAGAVTWKRTILVSVKATKVL